MDPKDTVTSSPFNLKPGMTISGGCSKANSHFSGSSYPLTGSVVGDSTLEHLHTQNSLTTWNLELIIGLWDRSGKNSQIWLNVLKNDISVIFLSQIYLVVKENSNYGFVLKWDS